VTQSLEPDQNLKEYRIGVDALKRGGAFDPAENSIVRVQAYRLRAKLADYYQHEGQTEDVRIDLEPGSYTPVIRECAVVTTLRILRFPGLVLDVLPFDPSPATKPLAFFYAVFSGQLDQLLRAGLRQRHTGGNSRLHLQLDLRARSGPWGTRTITYLSDVDSRCVVWSQARTLAPVASIPELEETLGTAGVETAQAVSKKIHALLSCNG